MKAESTNCNGERIEVEMNPTSDGQVVASFSRLGTFVFARTLDVREAALLSKAIQVYLSSSEAVVPRETGPESSREEMSPVLNGTLDCSTTTGTVLDALRGARDTFRHYGHLHRAKHTVDGLKKAEANEDMARRMDAAVGLHLGQLELVRHLKDLVGKARDILERL